MRHSIFAAVCVLGLAIVLAGCATAAGQPELPTYPGPGLDGFSPTVAAVPTPQSLTPIEKMGVTGVPVTVDIVQYRLVVDGLVKTPLALTYDEVQTLPTVTMAPRLECPGFFVDYAEWTGPLVRTILELAGTQSDAKSVVFSDSTGYSRTMSLQAALGDNVFVAHSLYGQSLPALHGYPLRLVASGFLGDYWVKWLAHIEVQ